jgi:hypothetical protein
VKLTKTQSFNIEDDLEHRIAEAENPLAILYSDLHKFCIASLIDPKDNSSGCLKFLVLNICASSSRVFQTIKTLVDIKVFLIITYVIYKQK